MRETDEVVVFIESAAINIREALDHEEPLDGDETQILSDLFKIELDWHNGNITHREHEELRRLMMN